VERRAALARPDELRRSSGQQSLQSLCRRAVQVASFAGREAGGPPAHRPPTLPALASASASHYSPASTVTARSIKIGLVQRALGDDKSRNVSKVLDGVRDAARRGAQVVCLPELFATKYFCQTEDADCFDLAEPLDGPTAQAVSKVARSQQVTVVTPLFERRASGVYHNSLLVIGPAGAVLGTYRKMHIPDDPNFFEKFYFAPGDLGFVAVDTPLVKLGPLICWDQWYPEAARLVALRGAEMLVYPTAIGWLSRERSDCGDEQLAAWRTIQQSHAIANGVFVVCVNRVGHEPGPDGGVDFWGHSFVCDPFGVVLAEAGEGEEVVVVECDLSRPEDIRRSWPFFRDRRIDAYRGLTARYLDPDDEE
jgi:N-carbamoylputrescine amidase